MNNILKFLFGTAFSIVSILFAAKIFIYMWVWFLIPVLASGHEPDLLHAAGLISMLGWPFSIINMSTKMDEMLDKPDKDGKENSLKNHKYVVKPILFCLCFHPLALFSAWILHHFAG